MQASKDALREAKYFLKKLAHEKEQVVASLESERNKFNTLTEEKQLALDERQSALKKKKIALEEKQ